MLAEALPWLLLIEVLGWATFSWFSLFFPSWKDKGFGLSKIAGFLMLAFVAWILSYLKLVPFSSTAGWSIFGLMAVLGIYFWVKRKDELIKFLKEQKSTIIWEEAIYLAVFIFFALIRSYNPDIYGAEKFMDFAFLNSLIRTNSLPPVDPWMSGFSINYYHFGYASWAMISKMVSLSSAISYNLAAVTIPALVAMATFSIGLKLTGKKWLALVGAAALIFLGNLAGSTQLFSGTGGGYNYWTPTRVISGTINEFPFFTFIWADLHPHFLAMPNFVLFIGMLLGFFSVESLKEKLSKSMIFFSVGLAISLAIAYSTSGWDLAPLLLLLGITFVFKFKTWGKAASVKSIFTILGIMILGSLPFFLAFKMTGINWGFTTHPSSIGQFLLVMGTWLGLALLGFITPVKNAIKKLPRWEYALIALGIPIIIGAFTKNISLALLLLFLLGSVGALWYSMINKEEETNSFPLVLICGALFMLALAEVVFIDNTYGPANERINSVFKFHVQAWLMFGCSAAFMLSQLLKIRQSHKALGYLAIGSVGILAALSLVYPLNATRERANNFSSSPTLDGINYLSKEHKGDLALIRYITDNISGQPVIVEAVKDPYQYWSRISANTGLPAVMGWANHENLWRRDAKSREEIQKRVAAVQAIYDGDAEQAKKVLAEFNVQYIVVGDWEKTTYKNGNFDKFETMGQKVFDREGTKLYKISN